jgi:hypothetical protein
MADRVPTKEEWGTCPEHVLDLDWKWSYDHYIGKSNEEVLDYLIQVPMSKAEDLHYMNRIPFRYYVKGYCKCLLSWRFDPFDMSDAASCFLSILEYKIEHDPGSLLPVDKIVMEAAQFSADRQEQFEASPEIYGSFAERLERIKTALRGLGAAL